jgi:hypothetical protein
MGAQRIVRHLEYLRRFQLQPGSMHAAKMPKADEALRLIQRDDIF